MIIVCLGNDLVNVAATCLSRRNRCAGGSSTLSLRGMLFGFTEVLSLWAATFLTGSEVVSSSQLLAPLPFVTVIAALVETEGCGGDLRLSETHFQGNDRPNDLR